MVDDIELPRRVAADACGPADRRELRRDLRHNRRARREVHPPDLRVLVVGVEILPIERGDGTPPVDGATRDRESERMGVFIERRLERCGGARTVGVRRADGALDAVPREVRAEVRGWVEEVDFLALRAADIANPHHARGAIKGTAEGIAQPLGDDGVIRRACPAHVGIRQRNRVVGIHIRGEVIAIDVDAEDFPEERGHRLAALAAAGIAGVAAVAQRDVQVAIGAEHERAAQVIPLRRWRGEAHDDPAARVVSEVRIRGAPRVFDDPDHDR